MDGEELVQGDEKFDMSRATPMDEIDISRAVPVSQLIAEGKLLDSGIGSNVENQAPVAGLLLLVLNPESLKDGQITTETQFFLAWVWEGIAYTYDPDGDSLELYLNGIPGSFMFRFPSEDGGFTYDGMIVQCTQPLAYEIEFFAVDSEGLKSNIVEDVIDVTYYPFYDTFDGELSSANDVKEYSVSVDFSVNPEFAIGAVRRGDGNIVVSIVDSAGASAGVINVTKSDSMVTGRKFITLTRPAGSPDIATYTLKVSTSRYTANDTKFHLVAGGKGKVQEMFCDVTSAVKLDKCYNFKNNVYGGNYYQENFLPNSGGTWFEFTGNGEDTIFLRTEASDELRFKIKDSIEFETLYDSDKDDYARYTYTTDLGLKYYVNKAKLNLAYGQKYYVVVYSVNDSRPYQSNDRYFLHCGEPYLRPELVYYYPDDISMVKNGVYTLSIPIDVKAPLYVDTFSVRANGADYNLIGGSYQVQFPSESKWHTITSYGTFTGPQNDNNLISLNGTTKVKFTAANNGVFHFDKVSVAYYFEQ